MIVELELYIHQESKSGEAILVSDTGLRRNGVWLAKSLLDYEEDQNKVEVVPATGNRIMGLMRANTLTPILIQMPEWYAIKKGLI